ncbi:hypothetical protein [Sulfitobacter sp. R18_1]|uniref:hypothetical protein n=1 Tax=Sulfitobacter sp. R18_1 TaxID=2821104 RepID=UPI001AD97CF5|nr:hypothetical protein [Sulfitobacter sp. R18_1]MBO9428763.1 hypothetical protein [Sulfitobacter sp. R18_1]
MTDEVSSSDIKDAMDVLAASIEIEYRHMTEEQVAAKWYFEFDPDKSVEANMYSFSQHIEMYRSSCRRWETMHHGSSCVVERVRDKYLMPKIKEFSRQVLTTYGH